MEGRIEYVGRKDEQVKVRGYRIELGEVEEALRGMSGVREAAVKVVERGGGGKRLVGYVVEEEGEGYGAEELRRRMREVLPEAMVPVVYVKVRELPKTPNGKVDRRALPEPEVSEAGGRYVEPRTAVEEILCGIWGEVLRAERVGVTDNFFELGGHSLVATQVVSRVRKALGVEVGLRGLFTDPTVEAMAGEVERQRRGGVVAIAGIERVKRDEGLELSYAQQRLWFIDQMEPGSAAYNIPAAVRLKGELDEEALCRSLSEIARRHEALRTTFPSSDGEPRQRIHQHLELRPEVIELRQAGEAERERELEEVLRVEAGRGFDLSKGPLIRAKLVRVAESDQVLMLNMHHIISDGWSLGVIVSELAHLYGAYARGVEPSLSEPEVQYADYAAWQRGWLRGEVLQTQLDYWKERLDGVSVLELPTDRPRSAAAAHRGAVERFELSEELAQKLRRVSRREGVTMFMTLIAGLQALLSRYSGQEDIAVGTPVAGRNLKEVEGLIGLFVNTLVMRVDLGGDPSVSELLGRVREAALGAYAHQDLPFEKLVEELQPDRSLTHAPLFQVMFNFQGIPDVDLELQGLKLTPLDVQTGSTKFDLTFNLSDSKQGLIGTLQYNTSLFEPETIRRMSLHFRTLLEGVLSHPDQRVSDIQMLSEAESYQVVFEWNETYKQYPGHSSLHSLFEDQVKRTPDAVAVTLDSDYLTYIELNRRSNQLAHYLRRSGIGLETPVAICAERSREMVIAILATLKAGGAYVPLDPTLPTERLAVMLEDTLPPVILTQKDLLERLPQNCLTTISLDAGWEELAAENTDNIASGVMLNNLAYVIYTSGSTGKPKGVMGTHGGACNHLLWMQETYRLTREDRVLQFASFSFDFSVWEILGPLAVGARVVMIRPGGNRDSSYVVNLIIEQGVTMIHFAPSMMQVFLQDEQADRCRSLRKVFSGGEALSAELQERFHSRIEAELHNQYGPTEASIDVTYWDCQRGDGKEVVPIGRPNANNQVYVLDRWMRASAVGVRGELYIGGVGVGRGYINRPDMTAEKFVPNAMSKRGEDRLYRTGDVCRWKAGGYLEYLGRVDEQVKVRGYRIELGEVEEALRGMSGVREAAVKVVERGSGGKRLVGYVVAKGEVGSQELREYVRGRLPDDMVPGAIVQIAEMPLTANGKLDRRALPEPEVGEAGGRYVEPRTAVEEILCGIWGEVLRAERVGVRDNFFELGGHSLVATQVVSRVRKALGVEVGLRGLFTDPTVEAMAGEVERQRRGGVVAIAGIQRVVRDEGLELSYAQQRLWFIDQMEPGSAAYNIPAAVRLNGELDEEALCRSLCEIARRHEALRTSFPSSDGEPRQRIHQHMELRPEVIELRQAGEAERERELEEVLRVEAARGFDLSRGPLIRAKLVRVAESDQVLMLNMHHIVSDGWSLGVIVSELAHLYGAYAQGREPSLGEPEVQYADYAAWQRGWLRGEVLQTQLDYWKDRLDGVSVLELPTDRPRSAAGTHRGAVERFELSEELAQKLRQVSRREGATMFMTLVAGLQALLARYSGQSDIAVGTPIAGRNLREVEGLIGLFVNTLVMRVDLGGDPSVSELLGRVREAALGAYGHQDVPFEKLVEELQPDRSLTHGPLFQVMMAYEGWADRGLEVGGLAARVMEVETATAKFDLLVTLRDTGGGLSGAVEYNSGLFERATVERLVGHYVVLVGAMSEGADGRVWRLAMMSQREREQIVVGWNHTAADYPRERCVHELFEQQAGQRPDAVAVVYEGEQLTYRELDRRANQLAHHLRGMGVGAEEVVGVCLERSLGMVVGLLGVMKAGGAYLPLDASYPPERLAYMIEDARAAVVLTQRRLVDRLASCAGRLLLLDEEWGRHDQESERAPVSGVGPDNLAYVIYTSGSTGKPKGVAVVQRNVVKLVCNVDYAELGAEEVILQYAPVTFDASTFEIWGCLLNGGRLAVCPPGAQSLERLGELMRRHQVTTAWLTAGLFNQMVEERAGDLGGLRQLLAGGEALSVRHVRRAMKEAPACRLINGYGPTECTTFSSTHRVGGVEELGKTVPIGRPVSNTRIYILGQGHEAAPVGVAGEVCVAGEGLGRGYLNRARETAERFVADPYGSGGRMYRTGDVGRYLADGSIEYVGRKDEQVKVRGYRIELGEVEVALAEHPAVEQAVVVAREDGPGGKRLVGYVVAKGEVGSQELREYVRGRLPDYMVPGAIVQLEQMPLTANGKLDRRALPEPEVGEAGGRYEGPRTAVEEILCGIWGEVLRAERVGVTDNFFELGGHSLVATQVVSRVRKALGVEVGLRGLFTDPTVEAMAGEVERQRRGGVVAIAGIERVGRDEGLELSYAQQRLWFIDQMEPGSAAYNIPAAVRLKGELDEEALCRSLSEIARRHEALRTTFPSSDGQPRQRIHQHLELRPEVIELRHTGEAERERELEEVLRVEAARGFDLSRGPLIRAKLVRVAESDQVLMLNMHHIVSDGWSLGVIVSELAHLYGAYAQGRSLRWVSRRCSTPTTRRGRGGGCGARSYRHSSIIGRIG